MLGKSLRITTLIVVVIGFILLITFSYQIGRWVDLAHGDRESPSDSISVLTYLDDQFSADSFAISADSFWLQSTFSPTTFFEPSIKFRPWLRWWWPGNRVDDKQLTEELINFHENGFGGVEIQPIAAGISPDFVSTLEVNSVDSKSYFDHLNKVMEVAQRLGMFVDLASGSGKPTGGPHVGIKDNVASLAYGESHVLGGKTVRLMLPEPETPLSYYLYGFMEDRIDREEENLLDFRKDQAELLAVFAAKTLEERRSGDIFDLQDYIRLNPDSIFLITDYVNQNEVIWQAPLGYWKIIAVYAVPSGMGSAFSAYANQGYVVDHFDKQKVIANYNYHFGTRTGLDKWYSHPLRSIFNDAFAFSVEQHYSNKIFEWFKQKRLYDPTPFLPVLLYPGRDNFLLNSMESKRNPLYIISENDARIRHDYAQTISDLFIEQFMDSSRLWAKSRGLLHRAQAYGFSVDIIRASGHADIPEGEQNYAGGSELFLKLITSGAQLYNRPLVSAEAFSHDHLSYMMTPQRMKIAVDKLLGTGFNQLIFHGTPYIWQHPQYGEAGWVPFASPFYPYNSLSTSISPLDPYWKHQIQLNQYVSRAQYLLRQGEPQTEVLIYYPFLGFPHEFYKEEDHDELYFNGYMNHKEGKGRRDKTEELFAEWIEAEENPRRRWLRKTWELLKVLERQGVNWAWVNDESLQEASIEAGKIQIRSNTYQALILPEVETIEAATARNLAVMTRQGGRIIIYGKSPMRQPGFFNYEENEVLIGRYMKEVAIPHAMQSPKDLEDYFIGNPIEQQVGFDGFYDFLKYQRRRFDDGSELLFFRNTLDKDRFFMTRINAPFEHIYWFDPWEGNIHALTPNDQNQVKGFLHGYGSGFLFCSKETAIPDSLLSPIARVNQPLSSHRAIDTRALDRWDLVVVGNDVPGMEVSYPDTSLFDWRTNSLLKYSSSEGFYRCTFELTDTLPGKRYILDLGNIAGTADIKVNAELSGSCIIRPYRLDITHQLLPGFNSIEIWITPPLRNRMIGKGLEGEEGYAHFDDPSISLVPVGLLGPVVVWEVDEILPDAVESP